MERRLRSRLPGVLLALPLLLAIALAGCGGSGGGSGDDDGIATAGETPTGAAGDPGGTGAGDLTEQERHGQELAFAACLREHGIDVADPKPGEGVRIQVEGDPAATDAAIEQCRQLLPDGGQPPPPDPEEREQMLAFAQCMRDNGVASFQDPEPGQGINIGPEQAEDPDFPAAERTCNEEIMGGQPETDRNNAGDTA